MPKVTVPALSLVPINVSAEYAKAPGSICRQSHHDARAPNLRHLRLTNVDRRILIIRAAGSRLPTAA